MWVVHVLIKEQHCTILMVCSSAVTTGGPEGAMPPLATVCAPPFRFIQNTFFGTLHNDKTTGSDGKRNNNISK